MTSNNGGDGPVAMDDTDASHLLRKPGGSKVGGIKHEVVVPAGDQLRVPLGRYTADEPAKGFSIEFDPEPNPDGSVVTNITSVGTAKKYRLVLHVANFGNKAVTVVVTEL